MKNFREELMKNQEGNFFGWDVRFDGDNFKVENEQEGFTFETIEEVIEHLELFA